MLPALILAFLASPPPVALASLGHDDPAPKLIYHFGKKEDLLQYPPVHNIPVAAWDEIMQSGRSLYELPPFRRGMYGTAGPNEAEFYGDQVLNKHGRPWVIAVEITNECRKPERVADPNGFLGNPRFRKWFAQARDLPFASLGAFARKCFHRENGFSYFEAEEYDTSKEGACAKVAGKFFEEAHIGVVRDVAMEYASSWYVRDRSCISRVLGSPEEMIQMMVSADFWNSANGGDPYDDHTDLSMMIIAAESLVEARPDAGAVGRVRAAISKATRLEAADPDFDMQKLDILEILAAYEDARDQDQLEEFAAMVAGASPDDNFFRKIHAKTKAIQPPR